jgi:hypothetical protein
VAKRCWVGQGSARRAVRGSVEWSDAGHGITWRAGHAPASLGLARRGNSGPGAVGHGMAWQARHGVVGPGKARLGKAWQVQRGPACIGGAMRCGVGSGEAWQAWRGPEWLRRAGFGKAGTVVGRGSA